MAATLINNYVIDYNHINKLVPMFKLGKDG